MPQLQALTRKLNLEHAVTFYGNLSHQEVLRTLSQAHVFVFPTRVKEGFPKAVLEAMACGLPIVASNVSVIPHLVGEDKGIVLEEPTSEAVARAVLTLMSEPARMAQMGRNARDASREYTLEAWRDTIGHLLRESWGMLRNDERT